MPVALITTIRRRPRSWLTALLVLLAVVAAACGSDEPATAAEASGDTDVLGAETFDGEAMSIGGETIELAGLADKDLVLWFWAPW